MKKKRQDQQEGTAESTPPTAGENREGTRNIFLFGRLENEVVLPVIRKLLRLNERDQEKPINLFINSSGGNGYNADAIIAVMHSLKARVNTICLGHALSGACEILASGTGERSSYEFATLMFHQTLWEADGDITNLEIQAAQGQRFREAQVELLHRCTGQERAIVRKDIERDHYMSAKEALEYGIIDKIMKHDRGRVVEQKQAAKTAAPQTKLRILKDNETTGELPSLTSTRKASGRAKGGRGTGKTGSKTANKTGNKPGGKSRGKTGSKTGSRNKSNK